MRANVLVAAGLAAQLIVSLPLAAGAADFGSGATSEPAVPGLKSKSLFPDHWLVQTNTSYAEPVLDYDEHITDKSPLQLRLRRDGTVKTGKIYLSGLFKGSYLGEWTDTDSAFPILTRFPDHTGTSAHRFFADNAALAATATPADWLTLYAQLEFHQVRFDHQDAVQFRKVYGTIGDLSRSPFYASFGRKTINFGDFDQYNPFTHNINSHFFRAESDGLIGEFGYATDRVQLAVTAIEGGRHFRVADTANDGSLDNFAVNGDVFLPLSLGHGTTLKLGGGYLHGTAYNHTLPHHPGPKLDCPVRPGVQGVPKCRGRNAAWDVRAEIQSRKFDVMAEYTATIDPWPATQKRIEAFVVQGRLKTVVLHRPTHFSAVYSFSDIGPFSTGGRGAPVFDSLDSFMTGAEMFFGSHLSLAVEYSRNTGFAPLINITSVANSDVHSQQLVIGGKVVF